MVKKIVQKVLRYNAVFEPCEEGGFTVTVPKLPGVVTEGDTFEQAVANVKDATEGYLLVLQGDGESVPEPDAGSFTAPIDINLSRLRFAV